MESRRIILLKKGYYAGRLTFQDKSSFAKAREELIIRDIEKEMLTSLVTSRLSLELGANKQAEAFATYQQLVQLTLPYTRKEDKIAKRDLKTDIAEFKKLKDAFIAKKK